MQFNLDPNQLIYDLIRIIERERKKQKITIRMVEWYSIELPILFITNRIGSMGCFVFVRRELGDQNKKYYDFL